MSRSKANLDDIKRATSEIKKMRTLTVKVGVPRDVGSYPKTNESILEVGERHEYGLGVPRRSFIRAPFIQKQATVDKAIKSSYKKIVNGKSNTVDELGIIGTVGENIVRGAFRSQGYGTWPDITEATKKAKGSSGVLIDTTKLVQSIKYWVGKARV